MSTAAEEDPALTARKKTTRAEVKAALKALTSEEMASQSAAIATHLLAQLSCFDPDAARTRSATDRPLRLGLYVHCARLREVDTSALLAAALALPRAEVYVPVVDAPDPAAGRRAPPSMRFLQIRSLADLAPRTMGILEPTDRTPDGAPRPNLETHATDGPLDVLLMPGLAFESTGARLGRGGGFYDAFLERYARACDEKRVAEAARGGARVRRAGFGVGAGPRGKRGPKRGRARDRAGGRRGVHPRGRARMREAEEVGMERRTSTVGPARTFSFLCMLSFL